MDGRPPTRAVVDSDGEDAEEEEEAGHPEANLVDGRVAHQDFTVLPRVQLLAHVAVERHLMDQKRKEKHTRTHNRLNQIMTVRGAQTRGAGERDPTTSILSVTPVKEQKESTGGNNGPSFSPCWPLSSIPIWTGC